PRHLRGGGDRARRGRGMSRVLAVIRREYLERVRSKAFIVSTVLGPTLLASFMAAPILLSGQRGRPLHIAIVDASGNLGAGVAPLEGRRKGGRGGGLGGGAGPRRPGRPGAGRSPGARRAGRPRRLPVPAGRRPRALGRRVLREERQQHAGPRPHGQGGGG